MKRIVRIFFGAVAVLCLTLLVLLATSSYWLPWAAPGILRLAGVEVDSAARGDSGELVLREVYFENPSVDLSLSEVRAPMPLSLLWHGLRRTPAKAGEIRLQGLEVRWEESPDEAKSGESAPGPEEILGEVRRGLALADRWLPPVVLEDISLIPPDGQAPYVLPSITFRSRELVATSKAREELPGLRVDAGFPVDGPWSVRAEIAAWDFVLQGELSEKTSGPELRGEITRDSGTGSFLLDWAGSDWIPSKAALNLANFEFPDGVGGIPEDMEPFAVDSLELEWDGDEYAVEAAIRGGLAKEELTVKFSLGGDFATVVARAFEVKGSWLHLSLKEPVRLDLETLQPEAPFRFSAFADLAGQDYYPARGELRGVVEANVGPNGTYPVQFSLEGSDLQADDRSLSSVELEGRLDFPSLAVDVFRVSLPEGSTAEVEGSANLAEETFSLRLQADLEAADLDVLAGQSTGLEESVRLKAEASGPWKNPNHSGSVRVTKFTPPGVRPLAIGLDWEGEGADQLATTLTADNGVESVRLQSDLVREGAVVQLRLEDLKWARAGEPFLTLSGPADIRLDGNELSQWPWKGLTVGEIRMVGEGRELSLQWNPPETALLRANGLRVSDVSGWLPPETSLPDVFLERVSLTVEDLEPVLIAEAEVRASWQPNSESPAVTTRLRGRLDETGADLTEIYAAYGTTPLLEGNLTLPITLHPWILTAEEPDLSSETKEVFDWFSDSPPTSRRGGPASAGGVVPQDLNNRQPEPSASSVEKAADDREPFWRIISDGGLSGSLNGKWSPELREQIHEWGGPYLEGADLELSLGGTVEKPEASLIVGLQSMILEEGWVGEDFPKVRNLEVELLLDAKRVLLKKGFLELRDSGIRLTGELPYPELLRDYQDGQNPDVLKVLESLRADAELQNWNAAVWKDRLPLLLRPQGRITGKIGLDPGLLMRGEVEVSGFSVRPTLYSSPVDNIQATLVFEGRQVRLKDAGALVGGGKLSAGGTVNLEDWLDPRYVLKITGENIPVARTTDMILRTDADLTFALAPGEETPLLQGILNLRNSTYLVDFDPFAPSIESGPGTRPPYFSVREEPFAGWRLDLTIEGQDFLRVRSSLFTTELSAALRLTRTLRDPLLLGSVRANSGRIRFPGMSMRIESLEAFIAPEAPNLLQIEADAIGQNRLYVVTMNASGSTESPQIQFSSTPTLSNAQIIRLLATGSLEGGGAGAIGLYLGQALLGPGNGGDTLADRLSVEIGQEVTENGRSTVEVIYRLSDRWSLEGEYDRYDTYNLNLVRILLER